MTSINAAVQLVNPDWNDLSEIIKSAKASLTLCAPYVSTDGVNHLFDYLPQSPLTMRIVTRVSPSDWANGISDPQALLSLMELLHGDQWQLEFWVHQRLHAKAYIADVEKCLMGSANLSIGGFDRNFELAVIGNAELAKSVADMIETELESRAKKIDLDVFSGWVKNCRDEVQAASPGEESTNLLADAQRALDEILGRGKDAKNLKPVSISLEDFASWLSANSALTGANVVLDRHKNTSGQNLTGHVKQTFFASMLFLQSNQDVWEELSQLVKDENGAEVIPRISGEILAKWNEFVESNATYADENCDFAVLSGYLPPSLGGTLTGGGGGSSTFKRILPLVALFLVSEGKGAS